MPLSGFLRDIGLFEGLSQGRLDKIAATCMERNCAPSEVIFAECSRY
ncbi:MAG: hypothetical protein ACR2M0_03765 [Chloroflexia bacterium]